MIILAFGGPIAPILKMQLILPDQVTYVGLVLISKFRLPSQENKIALFNEMCLLSSFERHMYLDGG